MEIRMLTTVTLKTLAALKRKSGLVKRSLKFWNPMKIWTFAPFQLKKEW